MAFEHKPGRASLFRNDRKEKDSHPDYKGDGKLEDGTDVWLSAWVEEGKGGKYFSISLQAKEQQSAPQQMADKFEGTVEDFDDDLPF